MRLGAARLHLEITTGEAAEMLGLRRIEFLDLLRPTGVGFRVELDDDDFMMLRRLRTDQPNLLGM